MTNRHNYFHHRAENTWLRRVELLLRDRAATGLPHYRQAPPTLLNRARLTLYRHLAFTPEPGTFRDVVVRWLVRSAMWANRRRWAAIRAVRRHRGTPRESRALSASGATR